MGLKNVSTLIVGASAAGLSCAAHLRRRNIAFNIIEKQNHVGHAWRNHYDRLHLHTNKASSNLPFVKFSGETSKYPSRQQVVEYLKNYCDTLEIQPSFNVSAKKISKSQNNWITETDQGTLVSKNLIVCTGNTNIPRMVKKDGMDTFPGKIIHSSAYKNGKEFKGKNVLIIGFGNSACEIAICLSEHGAQPSLSVRSPVNVIPRDILGIPVLQLGILQSRLSPKFADTLNKPLLKLLIGDIEKYGLRKLPYGPIEQIVRDHQIPLLDIGTMALIKQETIRVFGDVTRIDNDIIHFENSKEGQFDAIIMATGYNTGLDRVLTLTAERRADLKLNIRKRKHFGEENLYFCGYYVAPTGMLREIKLESELIASKICDQL